MKFLVFLLTLLGQQPPMPPTALHVVIAPVGTPATFFSQNWNQSRDFPSTPFGGMRLWNTQTTWNDLEPSSGTYNWANLDKWLALANTHGGKDVLWTAGSTPQWASGASSACVSGNAYCKLPPSDVSSGDNAWKGFITALVKHSLASSHQIQFYELWNEPDLAWSGTPAQLVIMAQDAYAIIHQLDPAAQVVGPSPSTGNQWGIHFLPAYYSAGGAPWQDIVGMHAYLYTGSSFSTDPSGIAVTISQLQSLMASYNIAGKQIFFTEGNWGNSNSTMSDDLKVAYLGQEYVLMWSAGIPRYYWYSWDDAHGWGTLWTAAGGIQPAGTAYGLLYNWLVGSSSTAPCAADVSKTTTCTLTLANGGAAEIIWNPAPMNLGVCPAFTRYQTLDNSTENVIANHAVAIGNKPILVY
jgi:hypothetical protein